jgi:trans-aconitate methyltransferase
MLNTISYTDTFFSELNPHMIRCSALMRGFQVPDSTHFTYCELGCGKGHSLLLYAAANPHAQWIGIDLSEEHIHYAEQRARKLGITNCEFIRADLTELDELPSCDYIVMHGLYTWVQESVQEAIHRLIETSLTENGLVLVSYNAYPGWHVYEPLLKMFREYSMHLSDDPFHNAEQGLGFVQWMHEQQSEYMRAVPSTGTFIEELSKHDLRYIIHEYYADHWSPLWFKEMNQKMEKSNLSFAGQVPFYLNIGAIALPEGFEDILAIGEDVTQFEMYKDFIRNTMFRWDVYARGTRDIAEPFESLQFGRVLSQKALLNDIQLPGCRACTLDEALHQSIILASESGHQTSAEISHILSLDKSIVEDAILNLLTIEQIKPIPPKGPSEVDCESFQSIILAYLQEALQHEEHVIPSLYSGSGIIINRDTALLLLAKMKYHEDAIEWIAEWMEIHGYGDIQETRILAEEAYRLFESTIPFWKRMRIL